MKTLIENYNREEFEIELDFNHSFKGRGSWNIECTVTYNRAEKTFNHHMTSAPFIDEISDMKADDASFDEIQNAYEKKAFDSIEESILEWCEEVNEKEEENA